MLREKQLDGTFYDKVSVAIERILTMAPIAERIYGEYTVMVSGGKDSTVITDLAIRAGVKCRFEMSWTGLEYPATVYFLREEKTRIEALGYKYNFIIPRDKDGKQITMWKLIEKYGFPTRKMRFCCKELKETAGKNAFCILGIRWAESKKRKNNRFLYEQQGKKIMVIISAKNAKKFLMTSAIRLKVIIFALTADSDYCHRIVNMLYQKPLTAFKQV